MHQRNNAILHKNINRLNILFARIIIFSFALAVSGCANPGNENHRGKTDAELVVCQFNMRFYKKDDGHISKSAGPGGKVIEKTDGTQTWEKRSPLIKKFFAYHDIDICGSQELYKNQIDSMRDMPDYGISGIPSIPSREAAGIPNHNNVIFYKKSRLQLLDSGTFWFSETPESESKGWGAAYPRNCNWGKFLDKKTGKIFYYFNMHFHHIGESVQWESAKLLVKKIEEISEGLPFFASGDLNSDPYSRAIKEIKSSGFMFDAKEISKKPPYGPDFTDNYGYTGKKSKWIDWVFVSKSVEIEKFAVFAENIGEVWLSDHFPLLVSAKIK